MSDIRKAVQRFENELIDIDSEIAEQDEVIKHATKRREELLERRMLVQNRKDIFVATDQCANMLVKGNDISPVKVPIDALGFNSDLAKSLREKGVQTAADLVELYPDQLTKILGGSARAFQKVTSILDIWGWRLSEK